MNSRALTLGIGLIFTIDIVFTLVHYTQGLPFRTTAIVITQCAIIVIFYLLVWKMEPFSTTYVKKVEQAKSQPPPAETAPPVRYCHVPVWFHARHIPVSDHHHLPAGRDAERFSEPVGADTISGTSSAFLPSLPSASISSSGTSTALPAGRWQSGSLTSRKIPFGSAGCWKSPTPSGNSGSRIRTPLRRVHSCSNQRFLS